MPTLLHELVTEQARIRPKRTAVVLGGDRLTYGALDALSNQLARCLKGIGAKRGDRVALLMPKSPMAIAALLGIYKADCTYVPLDPSRPASLLTKILNSCEATWLLAGGPESPLLDELFSCDDGPMSLGWLERKPPTGPHIRTAFTLDDALVMSNFPLAYQNSSADPAHILFTSASTGTPKGVVITHANVRRFVDWGTAFFDMQPSDRISGHPPLHLDLSLFDILGAFAVGAELRLGPPELSLLPHRMADLIRQEELTQWFSVPTALSYMAQLDVVRANDFPALKRVLWCRDVLPTPALMYWMSRLPHVQFTNLYGPTETTIASSYYTVPACPDDPQAAIPIGSACDGEELLVLDRSLRPVPHGKPGELYIGGVGLSPGYWRDPLRTEKVFVPDPWYRSERIYKTGDLAKVGADGLVYLIGRPDSQIKSRRDRVDATGKIDRPRRKEIFETHAAHAS